MFSVQVLKWLLKYFNENFLRQFLMLVQFFSNSNKFYKISKNLHFYIFLFSLSYDVDICQINIIFYY